MKNGNSTGQKLRDATMKGRIRIESLRRRRSPTPIAFNTPKTPQNAADLTDLTHSLPYGQTFTTWLCLAEWKKYFLDISWSFLLCFFFLSCVAFKLIFISRLLS